MGRRKHWSSPMWKDTRKPSIWKDGRPPRTLGSEAAKGVAEGVETVSRGMWRTLIVARRIRRWF